MAAMFRFSIHHPTVLFTCLCLLASLTRDAQAACSLPSSLQGKWLKTDNGRDITMTGTGTSGQHVVSGGSPYTGDFECVSVSGNTYIFGTTTSVPDPYGTNANGYFCWELVYKSASTYLLYQRTETQNSGAFNLYKVLAVTVGDPAPSQAAVCTLSTSSVLPTLLYKYNGAALAAVSTAQMQCSPEVFATYSYVKDGSGCSGSASKLDFCVDRNTARVDYTACATEILFSQGGVLSCLTMFTSGSKNYQLLYNQGASDINAFVCMEISNNGGTEEATVRPKDCSETTGTHQLTLTRTVSCPITAETTTTAGGGGGGGDDSGSDTLPVIIGAAAGVVVVALIAIIAILLYKLVFSKRRKTAPEKPVANGTSPRVDPEGGNTETSPEKESTPDGPEADSGGGS